MASERALTLHLEGRFAICALFFRVNSEFTRFAIVFFANLGGLRKAFGVRMLNALGGSLSGI